ARDPSARRPPATDAAGHRIRRRGPSTRPRLLPPAPVHRRPRRPHRREGARPARHSPGPDRSLAWPCLAEVIEWRAACSPEAWRQGNPVIIHNDARHQHFNASSETALALVVKAKSQYMFLGLTQQGRGSTIPEGEEARFGPREDWSRLWSPGVEELRKVVHS